MWQKSKKKVVQPMTKRLNDGGIKKWKGVLFK